MENYDNVIGFKVVYLKHPCVCKFGDAFSSPLNILGMTIDTCGKYNNINVEELVKRRLL